MRRHHLRLAAAAVCALHGQAVPIGTDPVTRGGCGHDLARTWLLSTDEACSRTTMGTVSRMPTSRIGGVASTSRVLERMWGGPLDS